MMAINRGGPRRGLTPARTFIFAVVALISVAAVVSIDRLDTTGNAPAIVLDIEGARQTTRNPFADQWEYTYEVRVAPAYGGSTLALDAAERYDIGQQIEVLMVNREGNRALEPVGTVRNLWWLTIAVAGLAAASLLGSRAATRSALGTERLVRTTGAVAAAILLLGALWIAVPWMTETAATTSPAAVRTVHVVGAVGGVNLELVAPSGRVLDTNVAASWWFSQGEPTVIDVVESEYGLLVPGDDRFGASSLAIVGFWIVALGAGGLAWAGRHWRRARRPVSTPTIEAPAH